MKPTFIRLADLINYLAAFTSAYQEAEQYGQAEAS